MSRQIFNNLKIKLVVFFIAFLVWFFVKTEDNYNHSFRIPVRITNLGSDQIIINNNIPKKIKIITWGKGREIFSLMLRKDIFYDLDLSKYRRSAKIVLNKAQIKQLHPTDIEVLNIVEPETIEVRIADLNKKKVAIIPEVNIHTFPGYIVVNDLVLHPDSVEIIGPENEIRNISVIHTEEQIYKDIKRDLAKKIKLIPPQGKHVKISIHEINLFADIQKLMEKPLTEIPVEVVNQPRDLKLTAVPSTLSLVLEGGTDVLLNITNRDVRAYIDYEKVHSSTHKNHLAYIVTPKGTRYRDVKPKRFKIMAEKIH